MKRKGFYELGLPDAFTNNYTKLNRNKDVVLFDWQEEVLSLEGVLDGTCNLLYAAPTSAGKTLVSEILVAKKVGHENVKKALIVFPFISLAREKYNNLRILFRYTDVKIGCYAGGNRPQGAIESFDILVCTIEKANNILNYFRQQEILDKLGVVIIDEIHLIGDGQRGFLLELICTKLLILEKVQIVGMSATVPNLEQLGAWLNASVYRTNFRPVPLQVQLCLNSKLWNVVDGKHKLDRPVPQPECVSHLNLFDDEIKSITSLIIETIIKGHQAMIFCPTKKWCQTMASKMASYFTKVNELDESVLNIKKELTSSIQYSLIENGTKQNSEIYEFCSVGVAFHHAGMTIEERNIVEAGFRNNSLKLLISTTTLSSGVNLPARLVVIRSCYNPTGRGLISSRVFQQMSGRAGRKGVDEEGHAVLICNQKSFKKSKELMTLPSETIVSQLHISNLQRALLESIGTGISKTGRDVVQFVKATLHAHQLSDDNKLKCDVTLGTGISEIEDSSVPIETENMGRAIKTTFGWLLENEFLQREEGDQVTATKFGEATIAAGLMPRIALKVLDDLTSATKGLNLETELHLIYLCTPLGHDYSPNWSIMANKLMNLPRQLSRVANICQVDDQLLSKINRIGKPTNAPERKIDILVRFFYALALYNLVEEIPLATVSDEFGIACGQLQSLQQSAAQYAGMISSFCEKLTWMHMTNLLHTFQTRIEAGVQSDLLDLVRCAFLNSRRARAFFKKGFKTLADIVAAKHEEIAKVLSDMDEFVSVKKQTGENAMDVQERKLQILIYLPGIKENLSYEQAAILIRGDALSITELTEGEKHFTSENQHINSFDQTYTDILSQKVSGVLDSSALNKSDHSATLSKASANQIHSAKASTGFSNPNTEHSQISQSSQRTGILSLNAQLHQEIENRSEAEPVKAVTEIFDSSQLGDEDVTDESDCETHDFFSNLRNALVQLDETTSFDCEDENRDTLESTANNDNYRISFSPSSSDQTPDIDDTDLNENIFNTSVLHSTNELDASKTDISMNESQSVSLFESREVTPTELNVNDTEEKITEGENSSYESDHDPRSGDKRTINFVGKSITRRLSSVKKSRIDDMEKTIDFNESRIIDVSTDDVASNEPEDLRNSPSHKELSQNQIHALPTNLSPQCKLKLMREAEGTYFAERNKIRKSLFTNRAASTDLNIIQNNDGVKYRKIAKGEIEHCMAKSLIGRNLAVYIYADTVWFCPLKSVSETVYELPMDLEKIVLEKIFSAAKQLVCFDIFEFKEKLEKMNCFNSSTEFLDIRVMFWHQDTNRFANLDDKLSSIIKSLLPSRFPRRKLDGISKCFAISKLFEVMRDVIKDSDFEYICEYEMPHIIALHDMRKCGFPISKDVLDQTKLSLANMKTKAHSKFEKIIKKYNCSLDLTKVSDQKKLLFDILKIERQKSLKNEELENYRNDWSEAGDILNFRKIMKALQDLETYSCCMTRDERIRPVIKYLNLTGRITMDSPCLQMVQNEFMLGNEKISIRKVFQCKKGFVLVAGDYRQLELRILAELSRDDNLIKSFNDDTDPFTSIGKQWMKKDTISADERKKVKEMIYGIIYGMSSKTLAKKIESTEDEAATLMREFGSTYHQMTEFITRTKHDAESNGFCKTITGRRRYFKGFSKRDERVAVNTTIQGSAADLVKASTVRLNNEIQHHFTNNKPKFVHQVHDELIYECPEEISSNFVKLMEDIMTSTFQERFKVQFKVKVRKAISWDSL